MTEPYKIESGIDLPPISRSKSTLVSTMAAMKTGQSFLIRGSRLKARKMQIYVNRAAKSLPTWTFETRTVDDGLRVWRTA